MMSLLNSMDGDSSASAGGIAWVGVPKGADSMAV